MKNIYFSSKIIVSVILLMAAQCSLRAQGTVTQTFTHNGSVQQFKVPACVGTVKTIHLSGANNYKAPVSDLANGIYFMTGQNNSGKINQKVIVNK